MYAVNVSNCSLDYEEYSIVAISDSFARATALAETIRDYIQNYGDYCINNNLPFGDNDVMLQYIKDSGESWWMLRWRLAEFILHLTH